MDEQTWLLEEKYHGKKCEAFFADEKRLKKGEPLAYIIGNIPFLGTTIYLDSRPLIPRTETEFWLEKIIGKFQKTQSQIKILDLCAGSGCIGVALLKHVPSATVDFAEIDIKHHPTITKNLLENNISLERTNIIGGDLFENIDNKYDYIFTNPPYIDKSLNRVDANVDTYEPHLALYAKDDGFAVIKSIIRQASHYLTEVGAIYMEHEPEQTIIVQNLGREEDFVCTTRKDQYGRERYTEFIRMNTNTMTK